MIRVTKGWLAWGLVVVALQGCNCNAGEGYVYERETTTQEGLPPGSACTVDTECQSGRCAGGVCTNGGCSDDDDCRTGEVCVFGQCEPESTFECTADTHPIIDINPAQLDFEAVPLGTSSTLSVTVRNLGTCLLTLQGIGLSANTPSDFACGGSACDVSTYPRRLPPNRSLTIDVIFTPASPGTREGTLLVRSDDEQYPAQPVPLVGRYEGEPRILVEPTTLDFGYVDPTVPAPGNSARRTVRVSNVGEGNAILTLNDVRLASASTQFSHTPSIMRPNNTVVLNPTTVGATDCIATGGCVDIEVTFTPDNFREYQNELQITYDPAPSTGAQPFIAVPLRGYSSRPPKLEVTPVPVNFGNHPINSMVTPQQLRLDNIGQTRLSVAAIDVAVGSSTDFRVVPPSNLFQLGIEPGQFAIVQVIYEPTVLGPVQSQVLITTNDPDTFNPLYNSNTKVVTVSGVGDPNTFDDILKVEMTFENGDSGFFGNDFRDVNLILESPAGDICTQPRYQTDANGQIIGIVEDYCAMWSSSGYGTPRWVALGAAREPERVILTDAGTATGNYKVQASYEEDCAFLPTSLLASLLGFGVDALVGYISSGTIDLGSADVAEFIANNCFDHASSVVRVNIYINGTVVQNCSKTLGSRGQVREMANVNRTNGRFTATCTP